MTPTEIAEWLGLPEGREADELAVQAMAGIPVPSTAAEQIAAFTAFLASGAYPGPSMRSRTEIIR